MSLSSIKKHNSIKNDIVQLLCEHGAEVIHNSNGFLPAHFAALFGMSELVDFFTMEECMTSEDRLKTLELLGVAQSVGFKQHAKAHCSFLAANLLRHETGCLLPTTTPTELEKALGCRESTTVAELQRIKKDKSAMIIQGILVGERILPKELKDDCLWKNLFYPENIHAPGKEIILDACAYGLKLETDSQMTLGTVLSCLQYFANSQIGYEELSHQDTILHRVMLQLEEYPKILKNAEIDTLQDQAYDITDTLGDLVVAVILKPYRNDIFEKILRAAAVVMKACEERLLVFDRRIDNSSTTMDV